MLIAPHYSVDDDVSVGDVKLRAWAWRNPCEKPITYIWVSLVHVRYLRPMLIVSPRSDWTTFARSTLEGFLEQFAVTCGLPCAAACMLLVPCAGPDAF